MRAWWERIGPHRHLFGHLLGACRASVADRTGLPRLPALTVGLLVLGSLNGGLSILARRRHLTRLLRLAVRGLLRCAGSRLLTGHLPVAGALRRHRLGGRLSVLGLSVLGLLRDLPALVVRGRLPLHRVPGHLGVSLLLGCPSSLRRLGGRQLSA